MIWYRHWLEMRHRLLLNVFFTVVIAVCYWFTLGRPPRNAGFHAVEQLLGAVAYRTWVGHGFLTTMMVYLVSISAAGTGITSRDAYGGMQRDPYGTLALPVSRTYCVLSRLALSCVQCLGAFLAMFGVNAGLAIATGHVTPWLAMASASGVGLLVALPVTVLVGLAFLWLGKNWGMGVIALIALVLIAQIRPLIDDVIAGNTGWPALALPSLGITAVLSAACVFFAKRKEL